LPRKFEQQLLDSNWREVHEGLEVKLCPAPHPSDEDLSPGTPAGKSADSCSGCGSTQASK
jgi:hypothetical protein